jgi:hypothetical protein
VPRSPRRGRSRATASGGLRHRPDRQLFRHADLDALERRTQLPLCQEDDPGDLIRRRPPEEGAEHIGDSEVRRGGLDVCIRADDRLVLHRICPYEPEVRRPAPWSRGNMI